MRKRNICVAGALGAALVLSGCQAGGSGGDGPVEIELLWHGGAPAQAETMIQQVEDFNASQSDVVVKFSEIPSGVGAGGYNQAISVAALAGNLPCVVSTDSPLTANFAWAGYIIPLDDYISDALRADLLPSVIEGGTYDGHVYNLVRTEATAALTGRLSLLEMVGARMPTGVDDPWTLEEFDQILTDLAGLPELDYAIDMKMNYGTGFLPYGFQPFVYSFGGSYIDGDLKSADGAMNSAESVEAFTWINDLFTSGKANPTPADDNDFINGRTGLAYSPYWLLFGGAGVSQVDTWGDDLVMIPMPDFGDGPRTNIGDWGFAISETCKDKDAAWSFIEWAFSTEEISRFAGSTGAPPALKSALPGTNWEEGKPAYLYIEQIEAGWAEPRPRTPAWPIIDTAVAEAWANIINGGADVQEELDKAAARIDEDLKANDYYPAP